jgi:hypothetical protein
VTVERLIRQDETGVWFVIAAHESVSNLEGSAQQPATEAQAKAFVEKFMALRMEGAAQALGFLSATAKSQYDDHNSGLSLYDTAHGGREGVVFKSWHITETREADANSYEVFVTIEVENGAFGEGFAVGPGQDYKGDLQPLVIRAVIGGP